MLRVRNICKSFDGTVALDGFSAHVREREVVGLVGPNGAGKTTLFNVVTGFLRPDAGDVAYKGEALVGTPPYRLARRGLARTFQELRLIYRMTALENVLLAFPAQLGESATVAFVRWFEVSRRQRRNREEALALLSYVGLAEKAGELADELSYGQQKLLSLACCLAVGGELLLLDEPVAGVAPGMVDKILALITDLRARGKTVVFIEHNFAAVTEVCDRVIFMDEGRLVAEGTPAQIRDNPNVIESYLT
jgi:ABC-type branched-subunit amino acid transport system ATPase component